MDTMRELANRWRTRAGELQADNGLHFSGERAARIRQLDDCADDLVAAVEQAPTTAPANAWIQTATGRKFYPLNPTPDQVYFPDVAHHLAQRNRFSGACRSPYSVAQHSVHASLVAEEDARLLIPNLGDGEQHVLIFALSVLLHDGAEAYGPDVVRPVKYSGAVDGLLKVERRIQAAVYRAAGLPAEEPPSVATARQAIDRRMLRTEQRDLMPPPAEGEDRTDAAPYPWPIVTWNWNIARDLWLDRFLTLKRRLDDIETGRTGFRVV